MSFQSLKKAELLDAVERFGVSVDDDATKDELVAALAEDGVTYQMYKAQVGAEEEAEEVKEPSDVDEQPVQTTDEEEEDDVLLKMERKNGSYRIFGYLFTYEHPYALVKESDAEKLINGVGGFRQASPKEAKEFYGQ